MGIFSVNHVRGLFGQWRRSLQIVFPLLACLAWLTAARPTEPRPQRTEGPRSPASDLTCTTVAAAGECGRSVLRGRGSAGRADVRSAFPPSKMLPSPLSLCFPISFSVFSPPGGENVA